MFLVFPITFAAMSMAYEQVFGIKGEGPIIPGPPPPPTLRDWCTYEVDRYCSVWKWAAPPESGMAFNHWK